MSSDSAKRAELLRQLEQAVRQMSTQSVLFSQAVADRLGMSPSDLESLEILSWAGPITAGRLAELTGLTTGAITGIVDRLERAGFVRREQDPQDRRRVVLHLVLPEVERRIGSLHVSIQRANAEMAARYSDQELALILDFAARATQMAQQETAKLRADAVPEKTPQQIDFSAPLGSETHGRLVFTTGAASVAIQANPALPDLYRAHFERAVPRVNVKGGTVSIRYHGFPFLKRSGPAEITLNGSIPWEIEIQSGASRLNADLREVRLTALTIAGGASQLDATLGKPLGTVAVQVSGGASKIALHRPAGVPARIHVSGGLSKLSIDGKRVSGIGSDLHWESPDFQHAADRYDITISGGVSKLAVDTWK